MSDLEVKSNVESGEDEKTIIVNKGPRFGMRHVQTLLMFLLLAIGYAMRVNLSVGIVAMTNSTTSKNPDIPTYDWDNKSIILSSFFMGYICLQVFAGQLGKTYGPKWFLVGAMIINSGGCILTPLMAKEFGSYGVMAIRILQGLFQGFFFPSVHNILGKWGPEEERSTLGNIIFTGVAFGTILALPITGLIAGSWVGWPVAFYFFGALGLLWCVVWTILGSNSPAEHKSITPEERFYIESSLGDTDENKVKYLWPVAFYFFGALGLLWCVVWTILGSNSPAEHKSITPEERFYIESSLGDTDENKVPSPTPWKAILTSMPVWAIVVANFGQNWGYATLLTEISTYLNKVCGQDISNNSFLSAAPYLALFLLGLMFGPLTDWIIAKKYLSATNARKLMNSIGAIFPAIALTTLAFVPTNSVALIESLLIIAVGINAAIWCGFQVNHVDLSPQFSGVLMGIGNGSSNIFSIISPLIVQFLVTDEKDPLQWRSVFLIASGVYIASDIFYVIFAKAERQWWDNVEDKPSDIHSVSTISMVNSLEKKEETKSDS